MLWTADCGRYVLLVVGYQGQGQQLLALVLT
jgi:hypothetical protein